MNNINNNYIKFKYILSGCRTILDAFYFADKFLKSYPEMIDIVNSMIHGKQYENIMDFRTVINTLNNLNSLEYKEEINENIDKLYRNGLDNVQTKTLLKILDFKEFKPIIHDNNKIYKLRDNYYNFTDNNDLIEKKCPHCNIINSYPIDTDYIICGYENIVTGFNWHKCGLDSCFKCGKKLCKSWGNNQLFVESNRFHNGTCCMEHAFLHNNIYPDEYCQCKNKFVDRNK